MKYILLTLLFISNIYASNSQYLDEVLTNNKFDIDLISTRLLKFSNNKLTKEKAIKSNIIFEPKIELKSGNGLYIELYQNKIILRGYLHTKNARSFGIFIRLIQRAIYIDIPQNTLEQTDEKLTEMMIKTLSRGYNVTPTFKDRFTHIFEYSDITKYAKYILEI